MNLIKMMWCVFLLLITIHTVYSNTYLDDTNSIMQGNLSITNHLILNNSLKVNNNFIYDVKNITGNYVLNWSRLENYPMACIDGYVINSISDTLGCVVLPIIRTPSMNYIFNLSNTFYLNETKLNLTINNKLNNYLLKSGDIATGNYDFNSGGFYIDNNNNRIGIGTTSPSYLLEVNGTSKLNKVLSDDWTNISITESQISDLTHTIDTNTQKTTNGFYLYNDSITIYFNETKLNNTINIMKSVFINKTPLSYKANFTNDTLIGYEGGNALCRLNYPKTHICTDVEIIDTINKRNTSLLDWTGDAWISSGGAKYSPADVPVNDCNGFLYGEAGVYLGSFWRFNKTGGGSGKVGHCANTFQIACCR